MCDVCHRSFLSIRANLIHTERVPGAQVHHSYKEYGCWACDGMGQITDEPFAANNQATWNVYSIPHDPRRQRAPKQATSSTQKHAICFGELGVYTWTVPFRMTLGKNWTYSVSSDVHKYRAILCNKHSDDVETVECDPGSGHQKLKVELLL
jgi:hypothetical protein